MKNTRSSFIAAMAFLISICFLPVFSQEEITVKKYTMEDFQQAAVIWNAEAESASYNDYVGMIIDMTECEVAEDCYPYLLSELLFYRYYSHDDSVMPVFYELISKVDDRIAELRLLEEDYPEIYVADRLFYTVSRYYGNEGQVPEVPAGLYAKIFQMPDATAERQRLIKAIGSAESMYNRFCNMLARQNENVALRFSEDSFYKTMADPSLVYVIRNEPTFALLKEALDKTAEGLEDLSFGEYADVYYAVTALIDPVKSLFIKWGVPMKAVLPEDISSFLMINSTDPFAVTCLDLDTLLKAEKVMKFLSVCGDMYIERLNWLVNNTGN